MRTWTLTTIEGEYLDQCEADTIGTACELLVPADVAACGQSALMIDLCHIEARARILWLNTGPVRIAHLLERPADQPSSRRPAPTPHRPPATGHSMTTLLIGVGVILILLAGSTETIWLSIVCGVAGIACLIPAAITDSRRR